jgi:hypothetical protein
MTGEYRRARRPPQETEANRAIGRPPETPDDLDEADGTEPDGRDTGWPGGSGYALPSGQSPGPAGTSEAAGPAGDYDASPWYGEAGDHPNGNGDSPGSSSATSGVVAPYREDTGEYDRGEPLGEPRQADASPGTVKIGLWGSPGSGKTTYLAALSQALNTTDGSVGHWTLFPNNDPSAELLINWSHQLINEQAFPEATSLGNVTRLAWRFVGDLSGSRYMRRGLLRRRPPAESHFDLDLIDVSGEAFGHDPAARNVSPAIVNEALDHLDRAQGLIYLFDPIIERDKRIAAGYMNRTLIRLSRRVKDEGRLIGPYLPHYIAVCITKFDHKDVFRQAREAGLVDYGPDGMPRVLDQQAEKLFDVICEGGFWPGQRTNPHGGALFVRDQLRKYFRPDRIRYYAISSIGYKKPPAWDPQASRPGFRFDPKNFSNIIEQDGKKKILGPIEPINVLEPLVDLHMQITGWA